MHEENAIQRGKKQRFVLSQKPLLTEVELQSKVNELRILFCPVRGTGKKKLLQIPRKFLGVLRKVYIFLISTLLIKNHGDFMLV